MHISVTNKDEAKSDYWKKRNEYLDNPTDENFRKFKDAERIYKLLGGIIRI